MMIEEEYPETYEEAVDYLIECCDWDPEAINGWGPSLLSEAQQCWRNRRAG